MKLFNRYSAVALAAVLIMTAVYLGRQTVVQETPQSLPPAPDDVASQSNFGLPGPCGTRAGPPATFEHVIWIWMENKKYSEVIGGSSAPYTASLGAQCGTATNYAIVGSPSLPNYIGATAGQTFGIRDDNPPGSHVLTADNLFRQVRTAGKTARSYQESMPSNCRLSNSGQYAVRHNPEAYYAGSGDRAACQVNNVPLGTTAGGNLLSDLTNNTLPAFSFITPNLCNDTHDCSIATGDAWLRGWLPRILSSDAYIAGATVVIVMYDEYTPVPNIVISPYTVPGTVSAAAFNHYSLLRTTEELLGITTYLAGASTAQSMRSAFNLGAP